MLNMQISGYWIETKHVCWRQNGSVELLMFNGFNLFPWISYMPIFKWEIWFVDIFQWHRAQPSLLGQCHKWNFHYRFKICVYQVETSWLLIKQMQSQVVLVCWNFKWHNKSWNTYRSATKYVHILNHIVCVERINY